MQMLTNVSVLYAYLVNGLLTYRWHDRHCRHLLHHDTFFNALFSTTLLLPELIEHTLERGVV
jgi:hypothetical protein